MSGRGQPLSIDSLLQQQRAEKEAASKPKFLSKEERAKIAIAARAAEIKLEREKTEATRKDRETLEREAEEVRRKERESHYSNGNTSNSRNGGRYDDRDAKEDRYGDKDGRGRGRGGRRDDRRGIGSSHRDPPRGNAPTDAPTGPRADRGNMPPPAPATAPAVPAPAAAAMEVDDEITRASASYAPPVSSGELDAIKSRYLGADKKKRKVRKMNDRKFVFDWDETDDTALNSSINGGGVAAAGQFGAQVMFGRGRLAGMDDGNGDMRREKGEKGGAMERTADPLERRRAAKVGMDERHWTEKALTEMKERDWRIFREDFSISSRGGHIPHPLRSWRESEIPDIILDVIDKIGYKEPSPIQRQAIPIGLLNRDIIGIAETGSGKTAAFVIPMLVFIGKLSPFTDENRHLGPYALILAPTRELAQQIESEARKFASPLGYRCVSIVGGRAVEEQQFNLRDGAEIIIATPGRLKDVIERHVIVLSQCRYVVMDEADRMVNLGFEVDLLFILDKLPAEVMAGEDPELEATIMEVDGQEEMQVEKKGRTRVTTLFSATMPPPVERLAKKYLRKPAIITIGEAGRAVDTVEQRVEFVNGDEKKKQRVLEILNSNQFAPPVIVFVNQKKTADMVAKDLARSGWSTATLHSGKTQEQREAALNSLRSGDADLLVATDLAGRGIDVPDVSLVINYQMANTIEAYVHRIGRTGRAGKQGVAITLLTNDDAEVMYELKNEISKSPISKVPVELAKHEFAQHKVTREMKRKRDAEDEG